MVTPPTSTYSRIDWRTRVEDYIVIPRCTVVPRTPVPSHIRYELLVPGGRLTLIQSAALRWAALRCTGLHCCSQYNNRQDGCRFGWRSLRWPVRPEH